MRTGARTWRRTGAASDALGRRVTTTNLKGVERHVYDENWQVIADLDESGEVVRLYVASAEELRAVRYRFQGREWSAATGLVNFRMRWYDAVTGRWLSKDPIGLGGGLNLYGFCGGDPINYVDLIGLCSDLKTRRPNEMGNYMAGYAAGYSNHPLFLYFGVRAGGMLLGAMGSREGWMDSGSVPDINAGFIDGVIEHEVDRVADEIGSAIDIMDMFLRWL